MNRETNIESWMIGAVVLIVIVLLANGFYSQVTTLLEKPFKTIEVRQVLRA
jgi:hypothetical protein